MQCMHVYTKLSIAILNSHRTKVLSDISKGNHLAVVSDSGPIKYTPPAESKINIVLHYFCIIRKLYIIFIFAVCTLSSVNECNN